MPEETKRTWSHPETREQISSASRTSPGVGAPYVVPRAGCLADGGGHRGVRVTEQHGAVRLHEIQQPATLDVGDVCALRTVDRVRNSTDGPERTDGRADTARHDGQRALEPGGVVPGACHLPARSSATRPAKYVSTARAPARLMAVSCSIAAASASTHPFSAAASTIAYSPLTW